MTNNKFSVIGGGAVGTAVESYYKDVKIYDKYHPHDSIAEVAAADYIFVAVPTPYNQGPDLTEMDDERLVRLALDEPFIISVPPKTTREGGEDSSPNIITKKPEHAPQLIKIKKPTWRKKIKRWLDEN